MLIPEAAVKDGSFGDQHSFTPACEGAMVLFAKREERDEQSESLH